MLRKSYTTHNFELQVVDFVEFYLWATTEWE
jgi:hypothetical protein